MYGPPRPFIPNNTEWNYHRPAYNPQWRHPGGPRGPFRGHHHSFNQRRPPFQPGNDNYWCETCDRGFPTQDLLNKHTQQHEKCNIDGCNFVAHPKMITKHIQMQHSTGLYKKIAKLNNPEEIDKWREERRKKYPTKNNIEKKAAELKEKIDRGEKMGLERNWINKDKSRQQKDNSEQNRNRPGHGVKRGNGVGNENQPRSKFPRNHNTENRNKKPPPPKTLPPIEENRKLKPFAGILQLQMDFEDKIEEKNPIHPGFIDLIEDDDEELKPIEIKSIDTSTTSDPVVCGALSSLMFDYGSSEEEDSKDIVSSITISQKPPASMQDSNISKCLQTTSIILEHPEKQNTEHLEGVIQCEAEIKNEDIDPENTTHGKIVNVRKITPRNETLKEVLKCKAEVNNENIVHDQIMNDFREMPSPKSEPLEKVIKYEAETSKGVIEPEVTVNGQNVDDDANDSGPEEAIVVKIEETAVNLPESLKTKVVRQKRLPEKRQIFRRLRPKLPSTLLHKLLFKEMQQERNIVLQCIRYIRRNNYFDKK